MALLPSIELSEPEKLATLRRLDQFRHWGSLDDQRFCLICGRLIRGYDIQVVGERRGTGPLRIICPTKGCHSIPMDWALPTSDILCSESTVSIVEAASRAQQSERLSESDSF